MKKTLILALTTTVLLSGCATSSFVVNGQAGEKATQETTEHYFVSGLSQAKETNAAAVCGGASKVAKVEVQTRLLDGVLGAITYGIYTPRAAKVYCSK